jgi:hypothetical protein
MCLRIARWSIKAVRFRSRHDARIACRRECFRKRFRVRRWIRIWSVRRMFSCSRCLGLASNRNRCRLWSLPIGIWLRIWLWRLLSRDFKRIRLSFRGGLLRLAPNRHRIRLLRWSRLRRLTLGVRVRHGFGLLRFPADGYWCALSRRSGLLRLASNRHRILRRSRLWFRLSTSEFLSRWIS